MLKKKSQAIARDFLGGRRDSNPRPSEPQSDALTD